jgi:hypothetical protein
MLTREWRSGAICEGLREVAELVRWVILLACLAGESKKDSVWGEREGIVERDNGK